MNVVEAIGWLAGEAFSLLLRFWPVTLGLCVATLIFMLKRVEAEKQQLGISSMLWLFPVLCIVWGGFVRVEEPVAALSMDARIVLYALYVLLVGSTVAVVYVAKGQRAFIGSLGLLVAWCGALCVAAVLTARIPVPL